MVLHGGVVQAVEGDCPCLLRSVHPPHVRALHVAVVGDGAGHLRGVGGVVVVLCALVVGAQEERSLGNSGAIVLGRRGGASHGWGVCSRSAQSEGGTRRAGWRNSICSRV